MANILYRTSNTAATPTNFADVAGVPLTNLEVDGNFKSIQVDLGLKANAADAALTGTPTAPTATAGTNTTQLATTAFVTTATTNERTATATLTNKTLTSPTINTPTIGTSAVVPLVYGSSAASGTLQLTSTSNVTKGTVLVGGTGDAVRLNTATNGFVKTSAANGTLTYDTNTYYNTGGTDVAVADGGTGLSTAPANGQLLIGNGTGYTLGTLTDGTGITITEGAGTITVTNSGVTSVSGTTNRITVSGATGTVTFNLPQDIHTGATPSFAQVAVAADPAQALHVATKQYVDNAILGLDIKASVKAATTVASGNVSLAAAPNTLDGVTLALNDRILVKNQTASAQNGIYTVTTLGTGANGVWARTNDMDAWNEIPGSFVFVEEGTVNADTGWVSTANAVGTLGTTSVTWTQFAGSGAVTAGTGISVTGNQVSLATSNVSSLQSLATNGIVARTAANTVTARTLTGTTNRLTITDGDGVAGNPTVDIAATYVGQTSITTLGTIASGTWQGALVAGQYGGTGVNNSGKTITLGGNLTTSGAFATTLTVTAATNVTLPISGTLASLSTVQTFTTNQTIAGTSTGAMLTVANGGTGASIVTDDINIKDTSAAFEVIIGATSSTALTASRALTLDVVNAARTVKLGGNLTLNGTLTTASSFTTVGAFATTLTTTAATNVTLPTTGTLATLAGSEALTNKTYNGLTLTAAATGFTVAGGTTSKTLTLSNTLTFTGTDASSVAFGTGGTVVYTANKLSVHAATTSAELAGIISDETGSGSLVFATSPALAGTPTAPTAAATVNDTQIATTAFANRVAQDQAMAMAIALG